MRLAQVTTIACIDDLVERRDKTPDSKCDVSSHFESGSPEPLAKG